MKRMHSIKNIKFLFFVILLPLLFFSGCSKKKNDEKILARINDYELYVSEFENEAALTMANKNMYKDLSSAKKALLDEIITKKLLIQEAQKENFDKEKFFMKEIERYWEQTLLKLLFAKKFNQFSQAVEVSENEILQEYKKMQKKVKAHVIIIKDRASAESIANAKENFSSVLEEKKEHIISGMSPEWFSAGDAPYEIEKYIYTLKPGEISTPFAFGKNWAVVKVIEKENLKTRPLEKIKTQIISNIKKRKTEHLIENWIENIRKKADIHIDEDALKNIELN